MYGYIKAKKYDAMVESLVFQTTVLSDEARLALLFLEKWGMVQGFPDGEDSTGRAKIGLMSIPDLINRAFMLSEEAYKEIQRRGWSMEVPPPEIVKDR